MMHWFIIYELITSDNGYDRYNFYGLSGDFTENSEDYGVYRFKRELMYKSEELMGISTNQFIK